MDILFGIRLSHRYRGAKSCKFFGLVWRTGPNLFGFNIAPAATHPTSWP